MLNLNQTRNYVIENSISNLIDSQSSKPIPINGIMMQNVHGLPNSSIEENVPATSAPSSPGTNLVGASQHKKYPWRKGKWSEEEEAFTKKLIDAFNGGFLHIPTGTTLRSFLSEKLYCDPMRITKKFAGSSCIGKQVFTPADMTILQERENFLVMQEELNVLEKRFLCKLEYGYSNLWSLKSPQENFEFPRESLTDPAYRGAMPLSTNPYLNPSMIPRVSEFNHINALPEISASHVPTNIDRSALAYSLPQPDIYVPFIDHRSGVTYLIPRSDSSKFFRTNYVNDISQFTAYDLQSALQTSRQQARNDQFIKSDISISEQLSNVNDCQRGLHHVGKSEFRDKVQGMNLSTQTDKTEEVSNDDTKKQENSTVQLTINVQANTSISPPTESIETSTSSDREIEPDVEQAPRKRCRGPTNQQDIDASTLLLNLLHYASLPASVADEESRDVVSIENLNVKKERRKNMENQITMY